LHFLARLFARVANRRYPRDAHSRTSGAYHVRLAPRFTWTRRRQRQTQRNGGRGYSNTGKQDCPCHPPQAADSTESKR